MASKKRLMLLGGLNYLRPVIDAAHSQGYHVITADYLPDNPAHALSDEYCNVSVTDRDAVLEAARRLNINGIMSFAVDPGVTSAAYVQEQLGLPAFGPYESVCILQNKDLFRQFLTENGFNVPKSRSFTSIEDALSAADWYEFPMIVKPTDSAGSKGVTRIDSFEELKPALQYAFDNSLSHRVIVEQFIEKLGCSSDSECFSLNGQLFFSSFSAQRFDLNAENPFTPSAYTWPSTFTAEEEAYLTAEIQRLLTLLKMQTSIYNVETRIGTDHKPYIMEVSPRGGGNRLAEMVRYATGVDLITACVRAAVGDPVEGVTQKPYDGHWAEIILHSPADGRFRQLDISPSMQPYVIEKDLWVKPGDPVETFTGANKAIGTLILHFPDAHTMEQAITNQDNIIKVIVE